MPKKKVVGYVRVSTQAQGESGLSLENQRARIKELCRFKRWELTDVLVDSGYSGKDSSRPQYLKLKSLIFKGETHGIVVHSISRLGRNTVEILQTIEEMKGLGVGLFSVQESFDLASPMGQMIVTMLSAIAQLEGDMITTRIREVLWHKKKNGRIYNGHLPFGLDRDGELLVANEREMQTVRRMRNLRSRGHSLYKIMKRLNSEGVPTKRGSAWSVNQIQRALRYHYGN